MYGNSKIGKILKALVDEGKLNEYQALAIFRCLKYSDQIADVSIGNMFREDIAGLLEEVS